jgi:hypothetical protein
MPAATRPAAPATSRRLAASPEWYAVAASPDSRACEAPSLTRIASAGRAEPQARAQRAHRATGSSPLRSHRGTTTLAAPGGAPVAPAVPGDLQDPRGSAPAFRRARSSVARSKLRHSPVGVSAVPAASAPEELQREQPHHCFLHVVTSCVGLKGRVSTYGQHAPGLRRQTQAGDAKDVYGARVFRSSSISDLPATPTSSTGPRPRVGP